MTIETALSQDLDKLCEIEEKCFQNEAFSKKQIAYLLADYNSISLVAKENSKLLGFIIGTTYFSRNALNGHIVTLDVAPEHRRKGVASRLMQEIEKIFKEKNVKTCHLEVREDNVAALNLYTKLGYKKVGLLENYYGSAHGIYLKKPLA
ncbi:ribosomal protein S18-alanine N-acetyltransferase [Candidatus Bathyarchaeota archaeon]|nr:ribosomal protein S18-alanine N-acetyltransferase [Candidatus Bathyarchaeota archaeon]